MRVDQKLRVANFIERGLCIIPGPLETQERASSRKQKHKKQINRASPVYKDLYCKRNIYIKGLASIKRKLAQA